MHPRFLTRSESVTPDPFFVEYISILCKNNQGFAGMTPLHEAVLFGSPQSVKTWIERSKRDEKNFLGQTPLHLAVYKAEHLTALLESGHDVNAVDNYGITPLMYAAATDQEEALYILINAHADLQAVDSRYHRTFFDYAILFRTSIMTAQSLFDTFWRYAKTSTSPTIMEKTEGITAFPTT
ncbi:26S proteasome non-ATPase regulatory subunit 10 [Colletotrichum sp. SAR 10_70]|nr:26S proteasome non-ATPase regulatory subunit 10 [Colletotrichum sp. SAR 10_71]KAI8197007.1 26S proteasome non-ATPase regulatory subunit 10 [Colletotrichum sp. SAR 10_70]